MNPLYQMLMGGQQPVVPRMAPAMSPIQKMNTIMQAMIHLPSTIAPMVQGLQSVEIINSIIDAEIRRVLNGLAETPLPEYAGEDAEAGAEDEEA